MNNKTATTIATILGTVGVLFMLAMAFGVMPGGTAIFLGVASFVIAGLVKKLAGNDR